MRPATSSEHVRVDCVCSEKSDIKPRDKQEVHLCYGIKESLGNSMLEKLSSGQQKPLKKIVIHSS